MVTAIAVSYNTRLLVEKSYNSIRKFYPDMPIILVDGSDPGNSTAAYVKTLASPLTTVMSFGHDVNHGPGMNAGINYCQTRYALLFDTDAELLEPCVGDMLAMMEEDTFGVGFVIPTAFSGFGTWWPTPWRKEAWHPNTAPPTKGGWMPYLHPYFHLIDIQTYRKFPPYEHSGAPCTPTMLAIYRQGLSNKIIKQFKDMVNGTPKFVKHDGGGTCRRDPKVCT
jgi:glycosyltransferase involved in cell wall biosynthesis